MILKNICIYLYPFVYIKQVVPILINQKHLSRIIILNHWLFRKHDVELIGCDTIYDFISQVRTWTDASSSITARLYISHLLLYHNKFNAIDFYTRFISLGYVFGLWNLVLLFALLVGLGKNYVRNRIVGVS